MKYFEAISYIEACHAHNTRLSLIDMKLILSLLGDPHKKLKFIHVAGTNGKGSTSSFIHSIIQAGGYQVGLYTSPHLHCYTDRIRINGINILQEDFAEIVEEIKRIIEPLLDKGMSYPAMFDLITLVSFVYYHRKMVDYIVLEVGLGGLLDATNVIDSSLVSVITPIGVDHVDVLGSDIKIIAGHKAGIIKPNGIVVYHWQDEAVDEVIQKVADNNHALIYPLKQSMVEILDENTIEQTFNLRGSFSFLSQLKIQMLGQHQIYNASVAIETVLALRHNHLIEISDEAIRQGIYQNRWAGRLELLYKQPTILIDGAHNLQGAQILKNAIFKYFKNKKINMVIGMLNNKDVAGVLNQLIPLCNKVIFTKPNNPKGIDPSELALVSSNVTHEIIITNTIEDAVATAFNILEEDEVTIFTGSLYLIGDARKILFNYLEREKAS